MNLPADSILQGRAVRLEPLSYAHHNALVAAANDGLLWRLPFTVVPSEQTMPEYLKYSIERQAEGREISYVIFHLASGRIIGSTRYLNIVPAHKRLEIGHTWIASSYQGTAVNPEMKYLLLRRAFEELAFQRVEFVTDVLNVRSRGALLGIGAKEEGVLRNHMLMPDGRRRDSVCFSVIDQEWPEVKRALLERLARIESTMSLQPA